jgi:hypothetical protein
MEGHKLNKETDMSSKRLKIAIFVAVLVMGSALAKVALGHGEEVEQKATTGVIQYKLVPVAGTLSQQQLQAILTAQGNAGWRFIGPFAVGTGPIPDQEVIMFSKP